MASGTPTDNFNLPQWTDTDDLDYVEVNNALDTVDRLAAPTVCTAGTRPTTELFTGRLIYETDTGRVYMWNGAAWKQILISGQDTGVVSDLSKMTNSSGWSCGEFKYRVRNGICQTSFTFTRTGGALASSPSGNITNVTMGTINDATLRPVLFAGPVNGWGGFMWSGNISSVNGGIELGALPPNLGIATNDVMYGTATYMVD